MSEWTTQSQFEKDEYSCDTLIIGSGAGGAVTAATLAQHGRDVIVVEEGHFYTTKDFNGPPSQIMSKLYRNNGAIPFLGRPVIGFSEGRCVGGGTVINGGIFSRLPTDVQNEWAIDRKLEMYRPEFYDSHYLEVENVVGAKEEPIGPGNRDSELLIEGAKNIGMEYEVSKRTMKDCRNSNRCPMGCPTGAKQSVLFNYLKTAVDHGARIFSGLRATRILSHGRKAHTVIAISSSGKKVSIKFNTLFLAGGAIQTPLLLRKNGISELAGKRIDYHIPLKMIVTFLDEINAEVGSSSKTVVKGDRFLIASSNFRPEYVALSLLAHGSQVINEEMKQLKNMAIFMALLRNHSYAKLFAPKFGPQFIYHNMDKRDISLSQSALMKSAELLFSTGATKIFLPIKKAPPVKNLKETKEVIKKIKPQNLDILTVHAMGSCAMGNSPNDSVTNPNGSVWETSNIYVTDASVLPTNIGVGPQAATMTTALIIAKRFLNGC